MASSSWCAPARRSAKSSSGRRASSATWAATSLASCSTSSTPRRATATTTTTTTVTAIRPAKTARPPRTTAAPTTRTWRRRSRQRRHSNFGELRRARRSVVRRRVTRRLDAFVERMPRRRIIRERRMRDTVERLRPDLFLADASIRLDAELVHVVGGLRDQRVDVETVGAGRAGALELAVRVVEDVRLRFGGEELVVDAGQLDDVLDLARDLLQVAHVAKVALDLRFEIVATSEHVGER